MTINNTEIILLEELTRIVSNDVGLLDLSSEQDFDFNELEIKMWLLLQNNNKLKLFSRCF